MMMFGACESIIGGWGEQLETFLLRRDDEDFISNSELFCGNGLKQESVTRACYNLDRKIDIPSDF